MTTTWFETSLAKALSDLDSKSQRRHLRPFATFGPHIKLPDGRTLIDLSSNDYLGLSQHPALKQRAIEWTERYGTGNRASRLVTGSLDTILELEEKLARFKGTEAALILNSGFTANASALPALFSLCGGRHAIVFTDKLNHASLHHGCAAAGVREIRYRHNDLNHLESLLKQHQDKPAFILTESVFSMDGDTADIISLARIAQHYNAALYIDEAHATGIFGQHGQGLAHQAKGQIDIVMGTLGKAMGAAGAYIAGSRKLIDFLINSCGGFIYSTALPPAAYGAIDAALDVVPGMNTERARLANMAEKLRHTLHIHNIDTLTSRTQIVPAVLGTEPAALSAQRQLEAAGILATAIRPPTVPSGTARLRFALSAALSDEDFNLALDTIAKIA